MIFTAVGVYEDEMEPWASEIRAKNRQEAIAEARAMVAEGGTHTLLFVFDGAPDGEAIYNESPQDGEGEEHASAE